MNYKYFIPLAGYKNKPNSNPIKPNCSRARMNVNLTLTKDYRKNDDFTVRINKPNSNPISVNPKRNANVFVTKDYENETTFRPRKNKPKQTQFQTQRLSKPLNWVTEHLAGKGIDSPRLSAELLLSGVLAMKRIELYTKFDKPGASRFVQLSFFRTPAKMRNVPCQSSDSGLF
jgi:hypothetical protein